MDKILIFRYIAVSLFSFGTCLIILNFIQKPKAFISISSSILCFVVASAILLSTFAVPKQKDIPYKTLGYRDMTRIHTIADKEIFIRPIRPYIKIDLSKTRYSAFVD